VVGPEEVDFFCHVHLIIVLTGKILENLKIKP